MDKDEARENSLVLTSANGYLPHGVGKQFVSEANFKAIPDLGYRGPGWDV